MIHPFANEEDGLLRRPNHSRPVKAILNLHLQMQAVANPIMSFNKTPYSFLHGVYDAL